MTKTSKKEEIIYTENEIRNLFYKIEKYLKERGHIEYAFLARIYSSISSIFAKQDQKNIKQLFNNYKKIITSNKLEEKEYFEILRLNLGEIAQKYALHENENIYKLFTYETLKHLSNLYPELYNRYEAINNPQGPFFKNLEKLYEHDDEIKKLKENNIEVDKKEIKKLLGYLRNKKIEADNIVGDLAENKNAQRYILYAEKNKISSCCLFWVSIGIMVIVASVATYLLWNIENIDTIKLWLRIPLGFLILLPSFFMMREAKKLKDKEFQYYDLACRIITSSPYIDGLNLEQKEKDRLKAELVKDFFGRPIECRDDGGLPPVENICEIIKACMDKK